MRHERMPALDISTLVVSFFGFAGNLKATACMRGLAAHQKNPTHAEAFSFGDPIPVLNRRELLDYVECVQIGKWYEPPVSFDGLARTYRAAVHHSSPIAVKRNILTSTFPAPAAEPAGIQPLCGGLFGVR